MNTENCINTCNKLLRGERSAIETYGQAIDNYAGEPFVGELTRIRREHAQSVAVLEENIRSMGGEPDLESGAWGTFATTVQGAANFFGSGSAVEALRNGEKAGASDYESALDNKDVMPECKELIHTKLLPQVRGHIVALEAIKETDT